MYKYNVSMGSIRFCLLDPIFVQKNPSAVFTVYVPTPSGNAVLRSNNIILSINGFFQWRRATRFLTYFLVEPPGNVSNAYGLPDEFAVGKFCFLAPLPLWIPGCYWPLNWRGKSIQNYTLENVPKLSKDFRNLKSPHKILEIP